MILLALSWPVAVVSSVAIAGICLLGAVMIWQTFAIVVRDDRQIEHERRLNRPQS